MRNKSNSRLTALLVVLMSALLFVAACAQAGQPAVSESAAETETDTGDTASAEVAAQDKAEEAPSEAEAEAEPEQTGEGEPQYGGILRTALHGEIDTIDPHQSVTIVGFQVYENIVESLVTPNAALDTMEPELATDWTVSDDGLTYTFHLREGVKFHNGKDFTADDVIFSFNRIVDPDFPGADASSLSMVDSVEAPDDHTVVFHLQFPFSAFLTKLEQLWVLPNDPNIDFEQELVGTGPFKFVEWVSGDHITLERFEDYWEEGKPYLDQVIYRPVPEDATKLVELQTGGLNFISNVPYKDVAELENNPDITVYRTLGVVRDHLGFNVTQPPFDNPKVRQAMGYLIDREAIAEAILEGYALPANIAIPKMHWAFNSNVENAYTFDPEKARQLLEEAGYPDGFKATIKVSPTYPLEIKMAELIAEAAREIGVEFDIVQLEWSTWIDEVVSKGDYEAEIVLISGGIDPDDFFYQWHHSDEIFNLWRYSTPELDALLDAGRQAQDQAERKKIYDQIQDVLIEEAPMVHIIYRESVMASDKEVKGFVMTGREDMTWKHVWIDQGEN
jgi:peptide/nickel transport system substrate-binding protein